MTHEKFSSHAQIVYDQAAARVRSKWPKFQRVSLKQITTAALRSGFDLSETTYEGGPALLLAHKAGSSIIPLEGVDEEGWETEITLRVHQAGEYLYFHPEFQLNIRIQAESIVDGNLDALSDALGVFAEELEAIYSPELSLSRIKIGERLEQERTASGIKWFCRSELED